MSNQLEVTTMHAVSKDRNDNDVIVLSKASIRKQLRVEGYSGKPLTAKIAEICNSQTSPAIGVVSQFVADGGVLATMRASRTKDKRNVLTLRFEEPKDSEETRLQRALDTANAQLAELRAQIAGKVNTQLQS